MPPLWYSRSTENPDRSDWEALPDHLEEVGGTAGAFASAFDAKDWGFIAGWLHDLGKATPDFQKRLTGAPIQVDHATSGARVAAERWRLLGRMLAYPVAGHHAGLPDAGKLDDRLQGDAPDGDASILPGLPKPALPHADRMDKFSLSFFTRMIFSCLVDADRLAAEKFEKPDMERGIRADMAVLEARLDGYLRHLAAKAPPSPVNARRQDILRRCREIAVAKPPGFFSLTVPTGGGKTLSALAFALAHARRHDLRRVLTIIPYTSIIEQTAQIYRDALNRPEDADSLVLEHHSAFQAQAPDRTPEERSKLSLAEENWDVPMVVTTSVQFLESLFSNRPGRCRKLHNIARSVILIDEAQMLPPELLEPCLAALRTLVREYGCTIVFSTATQPALNHDEGWMPKGLEGVEEIMEAPDALHQDFRRVELRAVGELSETSLAEQLAARPQVLAVVNTRDAARNLFESLPAGEENFHLSARMCPAHRSTVLTEIKQRLKDGQPCRVISTQLIEAGVDVDFPIVYRALAGLDSLIQSAGRCNREGRLERGQVLVFEPEGSRPQGRWQRISSLTSRILAECQDPMAPAAITRYFREFYDGTELDAKNILPMLTQDAQRGNFKFATAADAFRIIESGMADIIIPYDDDARRHLAALRALPDDYRPRRALQRYVVQVYPNELGALHAQGLVEFVHERYAVLSDESRYHETLGLQPRDANPHPSFDGLYF